MANGSPASGKAQLIEVGFEIAQRVGRWGIPGIILLMLKTLAGLVVDFVGHGPKALLTDAPDALGTLGFYMVMISIMANTKRLKDLNVTVAAEAKIDRSALAATVSPGSAAATPTSSDLAVRREIAKQINGQGTKT